MPLTKRELDEMATGGCQSPGCNHEDHDHGIIFHGRCHEGGDIEASYKVGSGILVIACRVCQKVIAKIGVEGLLGPTGEKPVSDNPNDEGGLCAALSIEGKLLKLNFGKSLSFVMMRPDEAKLLAQELTRFAQMIEGDS